MFNQPLFNQASVDKVTDMYGMFFYAFAFDQDLGWCVGYGVDWRLRRHPVRVADMSRQETTPATSWTTTRTAAGAWPPRRRTATWPTMATWATHSGTPSMAHEGDVVRCPSTTTSALVCQRHDNGREKPLKEFQLQRWRSTASQACWRSGAFNQALVRGRRRRMVSIVAARAKRRASCRRR